MMEIGIRDVLLIQAGFASAVEGLRALGLHAVELAIDREGVVRSPASEESLSLSRSVDRDRLIRLQRQHGFRVSALLCSQDFNAPEPGPQLEWVIQAARAAAALGIPAVRVDSIMTGERDLPLEQRVQIYAARLQEVLSALGRIQVGLGIENHGRQGNDPAWMGGVMQAVPDRRVGLTLDVGNWYWFGHPLSSLYDIYARFAPRVKATHVKSIAYPPELREQQREIGLEYGTRCCPLDEGDLDFGRIVGILRDARFNGALTIEDESLGRYPAHQRAEILRRDVAHLAAALAA